MNTVQADTTVAVLEVMKLMTNVSAGVTGRVAEVCVVEGPWSRGPRCCCGGAGVTACWWPTAARSLCAWSGPAAAWASRSSSRSAPADRDSLAARLADRAVCIGPADPGRSYLRPEMLAQAAVSVGADVVHPGYGFCSEKPERV